MAAIVIIISGHDLTIEVHHRKHPNNTKAAGSVAISCYFHFKSHLKNCSCMSIKTEHFSYKGE